MVSSFKFQVSRRASATQQDLLVEYDCRTHAPNTQSPETRNLKLEALPSKNEKAARRTGRPLLQGKSSNGGSHQPPKLVLMKCYGRRKGVSSDSGNCKWLIFNHLHIIRKPLRIHRKAEVLGPKRCIPLKKSRMTLNSPPETPIVEPLTRVSAR